MLCKVGHTDWPNKYFFFDELSNIFTILKIHFEKPFIAHIVIYNVLLLGLYVVRGHA